MDKLADSVLDYLWYLNFADEDEADLDTTLDLLSDLIYSIQHDYSAAEREAVMAAAQRRLASVANLSTEQRGFLEEMARGDFAGAE